MKRKLPPNDLLRPQDGALPRQLAPVPPQVLGAAPVLEAAPSNKHRRLLVGVVAMSSLAAAASFALYATRTVASERAAESDWMGRAKRMLPAVGEEQHVDGAMRTIRLPGSAPPVVTDPAPKMKSPTNVRQP